MRASLRAACVLSLASVVASCGGSAAPDVPADLSLYALVTTIDGTFFGPPLGPEVTPSGTFDATLLGRLQVVLEATDASGSVATLLTIDRSTQPPLVLLADHELYWANVPAAAYFTDPALAYRFRALLDGREIGRSDMSSHVFTVLRYIPTLPVGVKLRTELRAAPVLTAISPASAIAGSADVVITAIGSDFVHDSTVRLGGLDLATTYVSSTELVATIPAAELQTTGQVFVDVFTGAPGGGASGELPFTIGCASGTHLESGACTADTRACPIANGAGLETWTGSAWGTCTVATCNTGYHASGNTCVTDATCLSASSAYKRVFISSASASGNLGGAAGADGRCQTLANAARLGGTWRAWLSSASSSPSSRFTRATVPYRRCDGATIANNWTDLTDGTISNPINITEGGVTVGFAFAFTFTRTNGTPGLFNSPSTTCYGNGCTCLEWTSTISQGPTSSLPGAAVGQPGSTTATWTDYSFINGCSGANDFYRLYCFEQ